MRFTAELVDPITSGWTHDSTARQAGVHWPGSISAPGRIGGYDFTENQWWNPVRPDHLMVQRLGRGDLRRDGRTDGRQGDACNLTHRAVDDRDQHELMRVWTSPICRWTARSSSETSTKVGGCQMTTSQSQRCSIRWEPGPGARLGYVPAGGGVLHDHAIGLAIVEALASLCLSLSASGAGTIR